MNDVNPDVGAIADLLSGWVVVSDVVGVHTQPPRTAHFYTGSESFTRPVAACSASNGHNELRFGTVDELAGAFRCLNCRRSAIYRRSHP